MGYTALYRKFRPQTFAEMVGQEHITRTLRNQIMANRVGHAYLFNGGRGTGKTTSAKVLARAINCLNPKDGEPCNECEICKAALNGSLTDIVEMDAASNNSVEDIRSIREEVNFLPTKAKYRVYIIDEVHMLSQGAFNALLKTLEEPPEHVKFILATTEPQKLPATILSRCQRFDFKRISNEDIIKLTINENNKLYNVNNKGYRYNLPIEFSVYSDRDYSQVLLSNNTKYYMNVDVVGYYYKNKYIKEHDDSDFEFFEFEHEDKTGYLRITKNNDNFFVELCYNYAIIEVEVKQSELRYAISRSISILNSIKYNDLVIEKYIGENDLDSKESIYSIPQPSSKSGSKNVLQYIEEDEEKE